MNKKTARVAAIDLGTNTFHLVIADFNADGLNVIDLRSEGVKLGKAGFAQGKLDPAALALGQRTFAQFMELADAAGVPAENRTAVATSIFRAAPNGAEVLAQIAGRWLSHARIIEGAEEASLIAEGVLQACPVGAGESALIMDIGGGSTEFNLVADGQLVFSRSFEVGGWRLLAEFGKNDPLKPEDDQAIVLWLQSLLAPLAEAIAQHRPTTLIGSSGSFESVIEMAKVQGLLPAGPLVPCMDLPLAHYLNIRERLRPLTLEQRLQVPGLKPLRAEMIQVALVLLDYVVQLGGVQQMKVSTYALREGLAARLGGAALAKMA